MVVAAYLFGVLMGVAAGMDIYRTLSVSRVTIRWLFEEGILRFDSEKAERYLKDLKEKLKR